MSDDPELKNPVIKYSDDTHADIHVMLVKACGVAFRMHPKLLSEYVKHDTVTVPNAVGMDQLNYFQLFSKFPDNIDNALTYLFCHKDDPESPYEFDNAELAERAKYQLRMKDTYVTAECYLDSLSYELYHPSELTVPDNTPPWRRKSCFRNKWSETIQKVFDSYNETPLEDTLVPKNIID